MARSNNGNGSNHLLTTAMGVSYHEEPFSVGYPWSWPLNFNLTLTGAQDSPDYFFMAIRTPDGGIMDGPDGSQCLLWAQMGAVDPTLNYDMPVGMNFSAAEVPEPLPAVLMLAGMGFVLLRRSSRF